MKLDHLEVEQVLLLHAFEGLTAEVQLFVQRVQLVVQVGGKLTVDFVLELDLLFATIGYK